MAESVNLPARVAHFENTLRSALPDNSRGDLAELMQRWTAFLAEQTARLSDGRSEAGVVVQHVQNALMAARAINRAMISHGFSAGAQSEWQAIRIELNRIATAYGRPRIPDVALLTRVSPTKPLIDRPGIGMAMQKIEAAVDGLKGSTEGQWSDVLGHIQRPVVQHWIDDLEHTTDAMLSDYKKKLVPDVYFGVEESLMIASGLNPIMDNGSHGALAAKWRTLRRLLNRLARTFAYPPLDVNAIPKR
ncbi:MAG: hypothetical protein ABI759_24485 [Candidatus Solibacter sp.]